MGQKNSDLHSKGYIIMLKKTLAVIGVASLAGVGAMEVLPEAAAKSLSQYDGVQLATCSPCAAAKKACNPCKPMRRQEGVQPVQSMRGQAHQEGMQSVQPVQPVRRHEEQLTGRNLSQLTLSIPQAGPAAFFSLFLPWDPVTVAGTGQFMVTGVE